VATEHHLHAPRDEDALPADELEQRVLFSLLRPAVALAAAFNVPLKEVARQVEVAYFEHLRQEGLTLQETSDLLDINVRTAKRLSQQLKVKFLRPELEHNLPVKLEFMLRAEPMSLARLNQVLREVPEDDVREAIQRLIAEGRIVEEDGRTPTLHVVKSVNSLVRDTWLARIGGLNSLLENLADVTWGRFFDADPRTFARTLTFHVRPEQLGALQCAFDDLTARITALDEEARDTPDAVPIRLSHYFAPFNLLSRRKRNGHRGG